MATLRGGFGTIRPHGVVLAVEEHDLATASTHTTEPLGIPIDRVLGAGLGSVLTHLRELLARPALEDLNPIAACSIRHDMFDAIGGRGPRRRRYHARSDSRRFQLHVAKPIDPADLIARLARLVGRTVRRT